jgi:hypothetical protein
MARDKDNSIILLFQHSVIPFYVENYIIKLHSYLAVTGDLAVWNLFKNPRRPDIR